MTKDQDSCSTPKTPTDHATSGENLETSGRTEKEETKEEADNKGKSEELSAEESPEKMEVDRRDSPSNEEQSKTKSALVSESIILNFSKIMHYNT